MARTVYQQRSKPTMGAWWVCSTIASPRPPNCRPTWARISSPSSPSPWPTGRRSSRTTRKSASPRRSAAGLMWWAFSGTGLRSGGSSGQSLPSSTTRGGSAAAFCPLLPSTSAIRAAWRQQFFCPQGQPGQSARVTPFHHLLGHDQQSPRHANLLLEGLVWWTSWTLYIGIGGLHIIITTISSKPD